MDISSDKTVDPFVAEMKRVTCTMCGAVDFVGSEGDGWEFIGYDDEALLYLCPICTLLRDAHAPKAESVEQDKATVYCAECGCLCVACSVDSFCVCEVCNSYD